jgi:hypothetical protein
MPSYTIRRATPQSIARSVARHAAGIRNAQHAHGPSVSVRTAEHHGHTIVIRTTYEVEVDGRLVTGHMGVTDDGQVHYHAMPNASFASAVDTIRRLIDVFPDDFDGSGPDAPGDHHHGRSTGRRTRKDRRSPATRKRSRRK